MHTSPMDDLRIPAGPGCPRGLVVPAGELIERFSHASGPGGQGVNTADSRVQLSLDLATTVALNEKQRERALSVLGDRLSGTRARPARSAHPAHASSGDEAGARVEVAPPRQQEEARRSQGAQASPRRGLRRRL